MTSVITWEHLVCGAKRGCVIYIYQDVNCEFGEIVPTDYRQGAFCLEGPLPHDNYLLQINSLYYVPTTLALLKGLTRKINFSN